MFELEPNNLLIFLPLMYYCFVGIATYVLLFSGDCHGSALVDYCDECTGGTTGGCLMGDNSRLGVWVTIAHS